MLEDDEVERNAPINIHDGLARYFIFNAVPIHLSGQIGREPVRPLQQRDDHFIEKYDSTTLFFDAVFSSDGAHVILLAPPFNNLADKINAFEIVAYPSGKHCVFDVKKLDRHAQIWISVPAGTQRLLLKSPLGNYEIKPSRNYSDFFANKRVLFTLSKNNRLEWISDWARYYRDVHGATAVLIYDNSSTEYSTLELARTLGQISGIECVGIISWPFKYGPLGTIDGQNWDSDYCQAGALEHARWTFLQTASSAMNADVDELVVPTGRRGAFEEAERSWSGYIKYYGFWILGLRGRTRLATSESPPLHRDFDHRLKVELKRKWNFWPDYSRHCNPKWTVVPRRCPPTTQWLQHYIDNWPGHKWASLWTVSRRLYYAHFREIGTGWNHADRGKRAEFDPMQHIYDKELRAKLESVRWDR